MNVICDLLRFAGVGPQYRGYRYLERAVELAMEYGVYGLQLTKVVYPEVAERFQTGGQSVERDIRTALGRAWENGGQEAMSLLAGYRLAQRPTNRQFICLLADYLLSAAPARRLNAPWPQFLAED